MPSIYGSFCSELAMCVINKDMDRYDEIYALARKSCPEHFNSKAKVKYESDVFNIILNKIEA
jgi:hypothetical protein